MSRLKLTLSVFGNTVELPHNAMVTLCMALKTRIDLANEKAQEPFRDHNYWAQEAAEAQATLDGIEELYGSRHDVMRLGATLDEGAL